MQRRCREQSATAVCATRSWHRHISNLLSHDETAWPGVSEADRRNQMKAIVIGSGTIGSAVRKALEEKGHEVVSAGRKSGDYQAEISDPESLKALFSKVGPFEAVACAAGDVFPAPLEQTTDEQWANSIKAKGMGQINLVRAALPYIADKRSEEHTS